MLPGDHRRGCTLLVLAKAPRAGRVKTRLCPPLTSELAAALAAEALADTLAAVVATPAARRILVLDGEPGTWVPRDVEVLAQRRGDLAMRLAGAFADASEPALLIGMDTPQVTPALLGASLDRLSQPGNDAVLGHTDDGGFWAIGLRRADSRVFKGIPMSTDRTGDMQQARLRELGLRVGTLPRLRDVDCFADAKAVAAIAPTTRFAEMVDSIGQEPLRAVPA